VVVAFHCGIDWDTMKRFVGIDLGTSSVKVAVTDESGRVERMATRAYNVSEPVSEWREIDPMIWWRATAEASREVLGQYPASEIAGVGVTGQMHSLVCLDEDGAPVCPAIMWNDLRTAGMVCDAKRSLADVGESYPARIISTGSPALSLAWIKDNHPEIFSKIRVFVIAPDWIVKCLTGEIGTDWCEASTSSLFDLDKGVWSIAACNSLGIPSSILPEVQSSGTIVGHVTKLAGEASGIPVGTPVVRGTGDNPASAIPTGCFGEGVPVISLGTSGVLMYSMPGCVRAKWGKSVLFSESAGNLSTLVQLTIQTCGNAMDWLTHGMLRCSSYDIEDARENDLLYDTGRLIFYPFLNGDKTLYDDPSMRGAFVGISLETSRSDLQRAAMEGISLGFRQLLEHVDESEAWKEIRVVGGGARSDLWMQILSSVLNKRVVRLTDVKGAAQGTAMIAAAAVQGIALATLGQGIKRRDQVFEPNLTAVRMYGRKYDDFLKLHDAVSVLGAR
jgi:xylulokinase